MNYKFDFKELSKGKYSQEYIVDDNFLRELDYPDLKKGKIKIFAEIDITGSSIFFEFRINGYLEVMCDVCLDYFEMKINNQTDLIAIFNDDTNIISEQENKIFISKSENYVNLTSHFRDFILLSLPIKKVHPLDEDGNRTCNQDFLLKLEELSTIEKKKDPRWDKLKKIIK